MKKILVLGATGAMGQYLVPALLARGYAVVGVTLDDARSYSPHLTYIKANVKEGNSLRELLTADRYDGIVDFMTYLTEEFRAIYPVFLANTDHYIYLSTCRVFADDPPITETSARLLEVSTDPEFMATEDYALYKAREEDMLRGSGLSNFTIVRPATTYSRGRFQLVTLEADTLIYRMLSGKTVVLPEEAMSKQATLSWGGDVAQMIAGLMFNEQALGQDYNVATAEHHSWREIAEMYNEIHPFDYITVPTEDYLSIIDDGGTWTKYQLIYARLFNRITDNTKILQATGMRQEELMRLSDGLAHEYARSGDIDWYGYAGNMRNTNMDKYLSERGLK